MPSMMSIDLEGELGKYKEDSDSRKAALAGAFSALSQVWRARYGSLPTIGKIISTDSRKSVDSAQTNPYEQIMSRLRITPEQFARRPRYMVIGGRNSSELEKFIEGKSNVGYHASSMLTNCNEFTTLPQPEGRWFITLSNAELGLDDWVTTTQLLGTNDDVDNQGNPAPFTKGIGQGLGLELCLPEVGVYQRAADQEQPLGDAYWMAMKPIADSDGSPSVFQLERYEGGFWLLDGWAYPARRWNPRDRLVWALPQVTSKP